jgi:hypothetical protein
MSEPNAGMKADFNKKFHSMADNTAITDETKDLKFAKLNVPASVIDYLMDHYGFFDLVEVNMLALYILNALGHMEDDGFKFAMYKSEDGKVKESWQLDIHELIAKFRINLAAGLSKEKE